MSFHSENLVAVSLTVILCSMASGQNYAIGNSLTQDLRPQETVDADWHLFCGQNLQYIFDNPYDHCVGNSTAWPQALVNNSYAYISVQPYWGTNLQQDHDIISAWMEMQPAAVFVVHSGWAGFENFADVYQADNGDDLMRPSAAYISDLVAALKETYPSRPILKTRCHDLLFRIWRDAEEGSAPIKFQDMFADSVHMSHTGPAGAGRDFMHNALRYRWRQPLFANMINQEIDQVVYDYVKLTISDFLVVPGDMNRDDEVNLLDVALFIEVLEEGCYDVCGDVNNDGLVDLLDIWPFVNLVTGN